jgi:hypothetical protein
MTEYLPLVLFWLSMVSLIAAPLVMRFHHIRQAGLFAAGSLVFLSLAVQVAK